MGQGGDRDQWAKGGICFSVFHLNKLLVYFIFSFIMSDKEMMTKLRQAIQDLDKERLLELLHCGVESCDISKVSSGPARNDDY